MVISKAIVAELCSGAGLKKANRSERTGRKAIGLKLPGGARVAMLPGQIRLCGFRYPKYATEKMNQYNSPL